jgi:signal transduction histidine kinase
MMEAVGGSEGSSTQFEVSERASAEQAIAVGLLTVRVVHLLQGVVCLATGWKAYRRPRLALVLLLASGAEATWLARRAWSKRSFSDPELAWIDTGFGIGGLCVMAAATQPDDRTAWLNWMCPLTFGTTAAATVAIEGTASGAVPVLLAGVYLVTVRGNIRSGGSQLATAAANATSYAGFYVAARGFGGRLRSDSVKIEKARNETLIERERLSAERQRNLEHRLLHDSALQTLELIASAEHVDLQLVRSQARREATLLRRAISGHPEGNSDLVTGLQELADLFTRDGLRIELVLVDTNVEVRQVAVEALLGALRESLTNVSKHAGVPSAVVNLSCADDGVRLTVRDHGQGFDPTGVTQGFGTKNSIVARIEDIGGTAMISSAPDRGTKVTMWVPL